jgi:hypothetical protein
LYLSLGWSKRRIYKQFGGGGDPSVGRPKKDNNNNNNNNSVVSVRERTKPAERQPLVGEVSANFCRIVVSVVSAEGPYGRILGFLERSRYYFFQVAPQLYSRG